MRELSHGTGMTGVTTRREVTWQDPLVSAALARDLSGLDYLREIASGQITGPDGTLYAHATTTWPSSRARPRRNGRRGTVIADRGITPSVSHQGSANR